MMSMVFLKGDIHGNPKCLSSKNFPKGNELTKEDYVIICGDFGLVWHNEQTKEEKYWLDWLESKPFTTLFIDGNHENFDKLESYPAEKWNGGYVHKIMPSVIHLMRGQVFNLDGKKFFTFGGASSHDIQDGILDPDEFFDYEDFRNTWKKWDKEYKMFRVKGISWWEQELPTEAEMMTGLFNLADNNWEVDYIISHSPSTNQLALLDGGAGLYKPDKLTDYLGQIRTMTKFKKHFFGHMHDDIILNDTDRLLYNDIILV